MTYPEALALLEVDKDAPADVLRRAYLRKVKLFKPEKDPAGFQRLREAFELTESRAAKPKRAAPPREPIRPPPQQPVTPVQRVAPPFEPVAAPKPAATPPRIHQRVAPPFVPPTPPPVTAPPATAHRRVAAPFEARSRDEVAAHTAFDKLRRSATDPALVIDHAAMFRVALRLAASGSVGTARELMAGLRHWAETYPERWRLTNTEITKWRLAVPLFANSTLPAFAVSALATALRDGHTKITVPQLATQRKRALQRLVHELTHVSAPLAPMWCEIAAFNQIPLITPGSKQAQRKLKWVRFATTIFVASALFTWNALRPAAKTHQVSAFCITAGPACAIAQDIERALSSHQCAALPPLFTALADAIEKSSNQDDEVSDMRVAQMHTEQRELEKRAKYRCLP